MQSLKSGSAPLPPDPSTVHPSQVVDAHSYPIAEVPSELYDDLPEGFPRPPVKGVVQVKMDVSAGPATSV